MGNNALFPNIYLCGMSVTKKINSLVLSKRFPGWSESYFRIKILPLPGTTKSLQLGLFALDLIPSHSLYPDLTLGSGFEFLQVTWFITACRVFDWSLCFFL